MKRFALCCLVLGILAAGAGAETMRLELIPLQHRTPEEVMPVLRPLLAPGASLSGSNNQLIVKTTPANLEEIKQVLAGIDRAARRLMITVRQDSGDRLDAERRSLAGSWSDDDVAVAAGDGRRRGEQVIIRGGDADGNGVEYRAGQGNRSSDSRNSYRVQTVEGRPAFIRTGSEVPLTGRTTYIHGGVVVEQETTQFYDATSGFYVLPRVNGDRVTLLIAPRQVATVPDRRGGFDIQSVETTVSGRLGEWIRVGGIDQSSSRTDSGVLSSRQARRESRHGILLKVEEIR